MTILNIKSQQITASKQAASAAGIKSRHLDEPLIDAPRYLS
jgi:hypothetical protein